MAKDSSTDHILVEIAKPQKEGRFHELTPNDFHIIMVDMGILVDASMVNIWISTNLKIKERLEKLRLERRY